MSSHETGVVRGYSITDRCIICGTCHEICPTQAIVEHEWYYRISENCAECGTCQKVCPNAAIKKNRTKDQKID